ncbi:hypothetical protein M2475_001233 [Breznakia sp. PF5-3]|uniref:hypothetical protein n=1 Tax=unclassified Breznakia TaxID=2623764 RepID=UPI002406390E|nr:MULTISPECIES: hypothetical protein [unclassified Breznakia]MDF9824769.1 hypothetical protein [Breznakia sp. PM6-1]MDF9835664.1 hypothetical protein [Breznakia sp. PF5-3]MDF9837713.1 hypothetical protein [Breznakia sp. PFB2-8]MDF9859674.1 hypothetical protein [Breznakia sp. PH5-24]
MFAVNTLEKIEENEKALNKEHVIALLLVRPSLNGAQEIINEFNYIHFNSKEYCSVYAVGYSNDLSCRNQKQWKKVSKVDGMDWYYSDEEFVNLKNNLEKRVNWKYSGEIEILLLQSNPKGEKILNFMNYLVIDIDYGIRKGYIDSFPRFMESLVRYSKKEVEVVAVSSNLKKSRISVKNIVVDVIEDCKKIPTGIRKIIKDRLFYRTSRSYPKDKY